MNKEVSTGWVLYAIAVVLFAASGLWSTDPIPVALGILGSGFLLAAFIHGMSRL